MDHEGPTEQGVAAVRPLVKGDYVLATKYRDGDPYDGWALGWFDSIPAFASDRFLVIGSDGKQFRANGFRRCERVSEELGNWIYKFSFEIEALTRIAPINMWRFRFAKHRAQLEALIGDEVLEERVCQIEREAGKPRRSTASPA